MDQNGEKFDTWAIVELMGHRKLGGRVTEQIIAGVPLLRVDIPEVDGQAAFTQFYGPSSIYSLTPTSEDVARKFAAYRREQPVSPYELRALPSAVAAAASPDEEDEESEIS